MEYTNAFDSASKSLETPCSNVFKRKHEIKLFNNVVGFNQIR
jgi:hypothetical protein